MPHLLFTDETGRVVLRHHKPHKLPPARRAQAALEVDELPPTPPPSSPGKQQVMYVREVSGRKRIEFHEEEAQATAEELLKDIAAKLDRQNELLEKLIAAQG